MDGQNTLHGTLLVINQNQNGIDKVKYVPVNNEELSIPDEIQHFDVNTTYLDPPSTETRNLTFDNFEFNSYESILKIYEAYDGAWLLASFAHRKRSCTTKDINVAKQSTIPDTSEMLQCTILLRCPKQILCRLGLPQILCWSSLVSKITNKKHIVGLLLPCLGNLLQIILLFIQLYALLREYLLLLSDHIKKLSLHSTWICIRED